MGNQRAIPAQARRHSAYIERMEMKRSLAVAGAAVLLTVLAGCDGGSGPDPVPSPTPPPAVTTLIAEGSFSGLEPNGAAMAAFTTTRAGDLEVVVDWTFASNDLDVLLARGECTPEQLVALQCDVAALAQGTTAKPERVSIVNAAAGTYTLFVLNLGATAESFSFQILLTTTGAASVVRRR
jgi:hypothetical protein